MAPTPRVSNQKRNRVLHRFYEPLVLLYVLDRTQGDHLARPTYERLPLEDITAKELRRRFLDSLSYICDFDKGGDTTTAIMLADAPLTYYVACNKTPKEKVKSFLYTILTQLASVYERDSRQRMELENSILGQCTKFSEKRLELYWKSLRECLEECRNVSSDGSMISSMLLISPRV
jgi:hypothetical protein